MSESQYYQYSFISLICLGLLIQNYINIRNYGKRTRTDSFFRIFILSIIICTALEILFGIREAGIIGKNIVFAYVEEILYAVMYMFASYFWYITSECFQHSKNVLNKRRLIIVSIPLIIMVIVTALTPLHHMNFYFVDGHYVRGPFVLWCSIIVSVFIIDTGCSALIKSFKNEYYIEKGYFRVIFLYAVILLFAQGLQLIIGSVLPFRTMGVCLVVYIIQQKYIKENIYIDNLTGANNRNSAEKYIHNNINESNNNMQIALIDIDYFKQINDTYGHNTGDQALQILAKAFMTNLSVNSYFARYGGDEFLLITKSKDINEIDKIVENARITLNEILVHDSIKFQLDFSCGIIQKTEEMRTIPDVIKAADTKMYTIKAEKKH